MYKHQVRFELNITNLTPIFSYPEFLKCKKSPESSGLFSVFLCTNHTLTMKPPTISAA